MDALRAAGSARPAGRPGKPWKSLFPTCMWAKTTKLYAFSYRHQSPERLGPALGVIVDSRQFRSRTLSALLGEHRVHSLLHAAVIVSSAGQGCFRPCANRSGRS